MADDAKDKAIAEELKTAKEALKTEQKEVHALLTERYNSLAESVGVEAKPTKELSAESIKLLIESMESVKAKQEADAEADDKDAGDAGADDKDADADKDAGDGDDKDADADKAAGEKMQGKHKTGQEKKDEKSNDFILAENTDGVKGFAFSTSNESKAKLGLKRMLPEGE